MSFARFMSSLAGRAIRVVIGLNLILVGVFAMHGTGGIILAVVGAIPLLAGLANVCLFAPLFGGPFLGRRARQS